MMAEAVPPVRARHAELAASAIIVAWRLWAGSPSGYWKDWMLLLGVFWGFTTCRSSSKPWPLAALSIMYYLLGIYLSGQVPHALAVLGLGW
jgi:hypothetical protein